MNKLLLKIFLLIFVSSLMFTCALPEIEDINPPVVTLIYPASGTVLTQSVTVTVSAADEKEVSSVWYFLDGELIESKSGSAANFELDLAPYQDNQIHVFQGGAIDNSGNKGYSPQVGVLISDRTDITPPVVTIINPAGGQLVEDSIKVIANASDAGGVKEVVFLVSGDSVARDTQSPYEYLLVVKNFVQSGPLTIQTKAYDNSGNWSLSTPVSISVPVDNTPPVVAINYPVSGQQVIDLVTVNTTATDDRGVKEVAFFVDGDSIATDKQYPYSYQLNARNFTQQGNLIIQAKAFDQAGNWALSAPVTIEVVDKIDNTPPTVSINYPLAGQQVVDVVTVNVTASDDVGLKEVAFFVDGDSIATDKVYPYTYQLNAKNFIQQGILSIQAKAFDLAGNWTLSTPVTIEVIDTTFVDETPPVITLVYPLAGNTLTGTVIVAIDVQDNVGVTRVEYYVDGGINGVPTAVVSSAPWSFTWNTATWADGNQHTLYIKAYDAAGNFGINGPAAYTIQ